MDLKSKINYMNRCNRTENCIEIDYNNANNKKIVVATSSHQLNSNGSSSSSSSSSSILSSNKRKRRATIDEKDSEYENPAKRAYTSNKNELHSQSSSLISSYPSPVDEIGNEILATNSSETHSSSDCLSAVAEYDLGTPCSSTSRNDDDENDDSASPGGSSLSPSLSPYHLKSSSSIHHNKTNTNWHHYHHHRQYQSRGDVTPHGNKKIKKYGDSCSNDDYVSSICVTPTSELPTCPLPALSWANAIDVWNLMCRNDEIASFDRSSSMLENHPGLQPRMRAILLDWLIEVCEVYKLHRETYYLAVDYLDRYLTATKNVQKTHLQLIGITCLFVAAKVEEIYPPKIGEFAYVTDGACQEEDILQHELLLLKALDWDVSPVTIMGWLGVYMQLNVSNRTPACFSQNTNTQLKRCQLSNNNPSSELSVNKINKFGDSEQGKQLQSKTIIIDTEYENRRNSINNIKSSYDIPLSKSFNVENSKKIITTTTTSSSTSSNDAGISMTTVVPNENDDAFIYPQFSGMEFVQTAQLLDLCSLDVGVANYRYSIIAAAAMSHTFNRETAVRVSGFDWSVIAPCAKWMEPFFSIICEESQHVYLLEQNEQVPTKFGLGHICPNIVTDDSHIIQTHTTSMNMFDKLVLKREQYNTAMMKPEASPAVGFVCPEGLLTPPASSRKPLGEEEEEEEGNDDNDNDGDDINEEHDGGNDENNENEVNSQQHMKTS